MVAAPSTCNVRMLGDHDLERVIAIDRALSGRPRHRFFEKRFAAATRRPDDYIHIGAVDGDALRGFVIARVLRGEFGQEHACAVLDAIGVEPQHQEHGVGQALMAELVAIMRTRRVYSLQSEADWTNHGLLRFFESSGFELAPRLLLQRSVNALLSETVDEE